jgi:hypothetical protein
MALNSQKATKETKHCRREQLPTPVAASRQSAANLTASGQSAALFRDAATHADSCNRLSQTFVSFVCFCETECLLLKRGVSRQCPLNWTQGCLPAPGDPPQVVDQEAVQELAQLSHLRVAEA